MSEWIAAAIPRIRSTQYMKMHEDPAAGYKEYKRCLANLDLRDGTRRLPKDVMMNVMNVNLLNL